MQIRKGIEISDKDAIKYDELMEKSNYYDRLQFCVKIRLNSTYGCLSNYNFRFFLLESGESVTATGRMILRHQCRKTAEAVGDMYNTNFPLYETVKEATEHNTPPELALHGPVFNGEFPTDSIIYGDSVGYDSRIYTLDGEQKICDLFKSVDNLKGDKEYHHPTDLQVLTYDERLQQSCYKPVKYIMRHKISKQVYRVWISNENYVDVTEDHSLIGYLPIYNITYCVKPQEVVCNTTIIIWSTRYDGVIMRPVSFVEKIEYDDYVYDIEVDDTHTFFANNVLVHNTDSTYFKTYATNTADAIKIADSVAKVVNKSFQPFMKEAFLCQPGYDEKIKAGREVVSDRGIFVDKKRYMLHIVDNEGQSCDKLKIMGLELKKTTIPRPVQIILTQFIERLLKGENWDDIAVEVVAYKKELIAADDMLSIGLPKGINNLEKYNDTYLLDYKTRLPGHVAASILYNEQLDEYNDLASLRITSGMKIKIFYLKKPIGRFKAIALPTDLDIIPDWFHEYFSDKIDRDAQLYRLVDKPLEHILKAIDEEVPTAQLLHIKELFEF